MHTYVQILNVYTCISPLRHQRAYWIHCAPFTLNTLVCIYLICIYFLTRGHPAVTKIWKHNIYKYHSVKHSSYLNFLKCTLCLFPTLNLTHISCSTWLPFFVLPYSEGILLFFLFLGFDNFWWEQPVVGTLLPSLNLVNAFSWLDSSQSITSEKVSPDFQMLDLRTWLSVPQLQELPMCKW